MLTVFVFLCCCVVVVGEMVTMYDRGRARQMLDDEINMANKLNVRLEELLGRLQETFDALTKGEEN